MARHLELLARTTVAPIAALALTVVTLAACGSPNSGTDNSGTDSPTATRTIAVGANAADAATPTTIQITPDAAARAKLPKEIRDAGTITIGVNALPTGFPPLGFVGDDERTLAGTEPDFARMVAAALGLKPTIENTSWENLFVGLDSSKFDVAISNVTATEERKEKYDFATYRKDEIGFEVLADSTWNFDDDYRNLDGLTVAVGSGTNQENLILDWDEQLRAEGGEGVDVKYFNDNNSALLALQSGKIDTYFAMNPSVAYQIVQNKNAPHPLRSAGTVSGAGAELQGLIGATTKKNNGLAEPIADAVNHLIRGGQYAAWLEAYNLSGEAIPRAEVNPPGMPEPIS